jgi:hypothetical protein
MKTSSDWSLAFQDRGNSFLYSTSSSSDDTQESPRERTLDFLSSFTIESSEPNEVERVVEKTNEYASFVRNTGAIPEIAKSSLAFFTTSKNRDELAWKMADLRVKESPQIQDLVDAFKGLATTFGTFKNNKVALETSTEILKMLEDIPSYVNSLKQITLNSDDEHSLASDLLLRDLSSLSDRDMVEEITDFYERGCSLESFLDYLGPQRVADLAHIEHLNLAPHKKDDDKPEFLIPQQKNIKSLRLRTKDFLSLPRNLLDSLSESRTYISLMDFRHEHLASFLENQLKNSPKSENSPKIALFTKQRKDDWWGLKVNDLEDLSKIENITAISFLDSTDWNLCCHNRAPLVFFKHLTALDLTGASITKTDWLGKLKELRELNLSYSQMRYILNLSELEKLEALNLSSCKNIYNLNELYNLFELKKLEVPNLSSCKNLTYLNVAECAINSEDVQLNELKNLIVLNLKGTDYPLKNLSELEHVTDLDLSNMNFKDEDLVHLPKNIRKLNLSNCSSMTAKGFANLSELESLTDLYVSGWRCDLFTNEGIMYLKSLKNLRNLYLTRNNSSRWSVEALELPEKLRVILKDMVIHREFDS